MDKTIKPTPTPWRIVDIASTFNLCGASGLLFRLDKEMGGIKTKPEDAAFIVRAVNSHEELLALVWEMTKLVGDTGELRSRVFQAIANAEAR